MRAGLISRHLLILENEVVTPYFSAITCINIFSLVILFVLISGNSVISAHQKNKFQTTGAIVFFICIMEVLTIIFNNSPPKFRFLHIASNFIGFSLTPVVYISLSKALFPHIGEKRLRINPLVVLCGVYSLWLLVSLVVAPEYSVFYVDQKNHYERAKGFVVYVSFYMLGLFYFLLTNICLSVRFWKNNGIILLLNFLLVFFGTMVQILYPEIQITWLTIIFSILIYYIYHTTLYQQLDVQTCLLNYGSFQKWLCRQKRESCIVVAEIDNFAKLKINYSRKEIDRIIVTFSKLFNKFYKKYGQCYRIGSEEFLATINDTTLNFDELNCKFFIEFIKESFDLQEMPLVSLGYTKVSADSDLDKVLSLTDLKKREFIKKRPEYLS